MAITKLLRLKESVRGSPAAHLKHNLSYICNPDKCEGGIWIGGNAGTSPEIIFQTMIENKKYWGKEDGSQGFHYVISFPPELSVSEETAYQIAEDFTKDLLGDDYYYAFAVHKPLLYYGRKIASDAGFEIKLLPYTGFPQKVKGDRGRLSVT